MVVYMLVMGTVESQFLIVVTSLEIDCLVLNVGGF